MKVIKDGRNRDWKGTLDCDRCKSHLEIVATDIYRVVMGSGMDDFNHRPYFVVDCGACQKTLELDEAALPEWIQHERKDSKRPS